MHSPEQIRNRTAANRLPVVTRSLEEAFVENFLNDVWQEISQPHELYTLSRAIPQTVDPEGVRELLKGHDVTFVKTHVTRVRNVIVQSEVTHEVIYNLV